MELLLLLFICLLFFFLLKVEHFTPIENKYTDHYLAQSIPQITKPQKYLSFLSVLNEEMKKRAPITGAFRGSCDDKVNEKYQKEALKEAYSQLAQNNSADKFKKDPCVAYANDLCEFIDPSLYLSENQYFPPRWLVNTYKDQPLPMYTNIPCFNSNYDCCKKSLNS